MTFIPFPDLVVYSADGRFRVEICGQGKGPLDFFRDQSGFRYQLFDAREERLLWIWKPADSQPLADYPHEAWVDDRGWVVVRLAPILVSQLAGLLRAGRLALDHARLGQSTRPTNIELRVDSTWMSADAKRRLPRAKRKKPGIIPGFLREFK